MDKEKQLTAKERAIIAQARAILREKGKLGGRKPKTVACPICGAESGSVEFRRHIKGEHGLYYLRAYNPDGSFKTKKELEKLIEQREVLAARDRRYANPGGRGNMGAKPKPKAKRK